jgi:AcrR family transcriptional regulator
MPPAPRPLQRSPAIPRAERERRVLDAAAELFYARGVHEVGMDELIAATGLGKATVYRLFATKDDLIGAYLRRLAQNILAAIDADIARHREEPAAAISAIFAAISEDLSRPEFRGCPFNNASIEFADPDHPARVAARDYRAELHRRLTDLAQAARPDAGPQLGAQLAVLADGMYTSAAHLGPDGPAATGPALVDALLRDRR